MYKLNFTDVHERPLVLATDFAVRMSLAQFHYMTDFVDLNLSTAMKVWLVSELSRLDLIEAATGLKGGARHSLRSEMVPVGPKVIYDIHQSLKASLAGRDGTYSDGWSGQKFPASSEPYPIVTLDGSGGEITLSEKQAELLNLSCEMFARASLMQFDMISSLYSYIGGDRYLLVREVFEELQSRLRAYRDNGNHRSGITQADDVPRVAFEIHEVIRHRLSWDRQPEGGIGVNFDNPRDLSLNIAPLVELVAS